MTVGVRPRVPRGPERSHARSRDPRCWWPRRGSAARGSRSARARAPRAAAPPRRGSPPLSDPRVEPVGQGLQPVEQGQVLERPLHVVVAASRGRRARSPHAGVEQEPILRDHAHRRRREPRRTWRRSTPPSRMRPSRDRRAGTAASRTSTSRSPSRPRSRRGRPRGCRRRCRGARVPLSIRELQALDAHRQRALGQRHARDRLLDVDREVDHPEHLPPAGDGRLRLGEDLRQIRGGEEQVHEEEERRRRAPR